jgi:hypothetical protein
MDIKDHQEEDSVANNSTHWLRGGGFDYFPGAVGSTNRAWAEPAVFNVSYGCRAARTFR